MDLSIVIPAYNEGARILGTVDSVCAHLNQRDWAYEIVVVDDGSTDATASLVEEARSERPALRLVRADTNLGKGGAIRLGAQVSHGDIVGFLDADDKTDICGIDDVFKCLEAGADIVIGDRTLSETSITTDRRAYRAWGSRVFRWLIRAWLGLGDLPDTQCGFKFYRASCLRELHERACIEGYMFDVELLLLARQTAKRIEAIPVLWRDDPDSRFRPLSGSWRNLRELWRIRRRHI
ncbi:MAG: glycosyltransferase [Gemmatimonadetes bacterium]|jgi:dolichyl-phosphate beta-glucosyltransferase|nr:glycosyltransferase [Gemmatimonadota bacterium]MBT6145306.1 glycosyltransferase [Gemmatimonadota bacterium]MBT7861519.1 glycosyltransferase [Gemmatimonadota bacterium]